MSLNFLRNIVFIIVLLLAQTLLLNHISVFGCATPLLYVYFALTVQRGEAKWATLLWCFFMGGHLHQYTRRSSCLNDARGLLAALRCRTVRATR